MFKKNKPDVLLGDFNSFYSTIKTQYDDFLNNHQQYYKKISTSSKQPNIKYVKRWSEDVVKLLIDNNYTYAVPENEIMAVTNNFIGITSDMIWYNSDKLRLVKCEILNISSTTDTYVDSYDCISLHNPVYVKFKIISNSGNNIDDSAIISVPENISKFSIMSFNISNAVCNNFENYKDYNNVDIMCTQETGNVDKIANVYNLIDLTGNEYDDKSKTKNGVFVKAPTKINTSNIIKNGTQPTQYGMTREFALIFNYGEIKIANLQFMSVTRIIPFIAPNLYDQSFIFENYIEERTELLKLILTSKPDIILGDFNTEYLNDRDKEQRYIENIKKMLQIYLTSIKKTNFKNLITNQKITFFLNFNKCIFDLLIKNGYNYSYPNNENSLITNTLTKSITTGIWYRSNKLKLIKSEIINITKNTDDVVQSENCVSFHNPVYAEFEIFSNVSTGGNMFSNNTHNNYARKYEKYIHKITNLIKI